MRRGITLLELALILAIVFVVVWIALPTLYPDKDEAQILFAKDQLVYLHEKEQAYFRLHGTYAPFSMIAADENLGGQFDQRFAEDLPVVNGVTFVGPRQEALIYEIVAILPDDTRYTVDQSGQVTLLKSSDPLE